MTGRPKLLDLYCGAGGAGRGYQDAGFDITGIDIAPQPNYPGRFIQADALTYLAEHGREYAAVHASPPCQSYSFGVRSSSSRHSMTLGKDEPALIAPTHELLVELGVPWVIENVAGARAHMPVEPVLLCGSFFGMMIPRHRLFAASFDIPAPIFHNCRGLSKHAAATLGWDRRDMTVTGKGRGAGTSARWSLLMGIDFHMTQRELAESIPPAYTRHIGGHLLASGGF